MASILELNQRLVQCVRVLADSHEVIAGLVIHDPPRAAEAPVRRADASRLRALATQWEQNPPPQSV